MREFKFRVWDILNKKMLEWGKIFDLPAWEIFPGTPEQRAFEVMQYTGLKDKNGNEIYEGDIYHMGDENIKYIVTWNDTGLTGKQLRSRSYAGLSYWQDKIEIIGNIYENPELLKRGKTH